MEDTTIQEASFEHAGRQIHYATAGKQGGRPVLVFYPMGSSRRCLAIVEEEALELGIWLICCNRPGNGTSSPTEPPDSIKSAAWQLDTAVEDLRHLLDELSIEKASLLFLCAGTPFAVKFASKYPERTAKMLGVACWISPADCEACGRVFQFASTLPTFALDVIGGLWKFGNTLSFCMPAMPSSFVTSQLQPSEREPFHSSEGKKSKLEKLTIARSETGTNGDHLDLPVLLASYEDLNLELPSAQNLKLLHSKLDELISIDAARWFSKKLGVELEELESNSHTGCLLMLNSDIPRALTFL
eukprot:Skav207965  [mRNA]  locus=scaffold495:20319:21218:+ [translate_table: standard]